MTKPPPALAGLDDPFEIGHRDEIDMRPTLLRVLTDLYLQRPAHTLEDERCYTELALRLVDAVDVSQRTALAARLARYAAAPRPVIERLVRDVTEVARPILDHPTCLTPAERAGLATERSVDRDIVSPQQPVLAPAEPEPPAPFHPSAATEACELSELFYAASAPERRLILMNLDHAALIPAACVSTTMHAAIQRLESAALERDSEALERELARMLGLSRTLARRIVNDALGEPMVVVAKAANLPADALQRLLTLLDGSVSSSVDRLAALAALHSEISVEAACRLITIWRTADAGRAMVRENNSRASFWPGGPRT